MCWVENNLWILLLYIWNHITLHGGYIEEAAVKVAYAKKDDGTTKGEVEEADASAMQNSENGAFSHPVTTAATLAMAATGAMIW